MPSYAMQLIASAAGNELSGIATASYMLIGNNVAPRYERALRAFTGYALDSMLILGHFAFGGIVDPHLPQTYVFIAKHLASGRS